MRVPAVFAYAPNSLEAAGITTLTNYVAKHDLRGKTAFLRLELNVTFEIKDGQLAIKDDKRILKALPDLITLLKAGANVVIAYHVEDKANVAQTNDGCYNNRLICEALGRLLGNQVGRPIKIIRVEENQFWGKEAFEKVTGLEAGEADVLLLQNVRMNPDDRRAEKKNSPALVSGLVDAVDLVVDAATGVMHRVGATNVKIKQVTKAAGKPVIAGDIFIGEIDTLQRLINGMRENPAASVVAIGGSKIVGDAKSDELGKIDVLKTFIAMGVGHILISGKMSLPFMVAKGWLIGSARVDEAEQEAATAILAAAHKAGTEIHIPRDFVTVALDDLDAALKKESVDYSVEANLQRGRIQLDIGPETQAIYEGIIHAATYGFVNGPAGLFENALFAKGTHAIARAISTRPQTGLFIVGGGDTGAAMGDILGKSTEFNVQLPGGGAPFTYIGKGGDLESINAMRHGVPQ